MKPIRLPRDFLVEELLCDEHNLQEALNPCKVKFTKSLSKDMRSQLRLLEFSYGMPRRSNGA